MRINCHTHIFNLRSVFTKETLTILLNKLREKNWPPFAVKALEKLALKHIKGEMLTDDALAREFYDMMTQWKFLPNSPTLMNAGTDLGQLSACFVLPIKDSIEDIFDAVKHAAMGHEFGMRTLLNDMPIIHYHDAVGLLNGGQSVRHDDAGAAMHETLQSLLYQAFGFVIKRTGGFVEQQNWGVF